MKKNIASKLSIRELEYSSSCVVVEEDFIENKHKANVIVTNKGETTLLFMEVTTSFMVILLLHHGSSMFQRVQSTNEDSDDGIEKYVKSITVEFQI
ncbi:uncharacterized protein G2W53_002073 [Senna tora]|uniref:Uncharacterized protein n=1 Tax=Senna tora TaxID=362788 RepID=A0A834XGY4_9FABA|nr:uncharacterized protein G2W53_002073 [Senna tora]